MTNAHKPGWKTTEFLFSVLACALSASLAFDLFAQGSAALRVVGAAGMFLTSLGYTVSRTSVKSNALRAIEQATKTLIVLLVALTMVGCGATARQKTIRVTYESINIAADALPQFVETHSRAIVDDAHRAGKTKEEASLELETFLAKAKHADLTVRACYRMVAAAAMLDDERSLAALLQVAKLLHDELSELGVIK